MKGGNGVREANGITLCSKEEISYCVADNASWMAPVSGANLTAKAVKEKCGSLQNPENVSTALTCWIAAVSATEEKILAAKNAKYTKK